MKTKLKAKVDLALKIKELENKIKTILEELAEEGVSEVEQKSLKATLKTLKETPIGTWMDGLMKFQYNPTLSEFP